MSKQANTKLIGGFVVGAIVLVVVGVLLFGSGKLFSRQKKFVLFFEGSVKGLNVGAPVDFRGVKVGSVTDIKIVLDDKNLSLRIPVFIEINKEKVSFAGTESEIKKLVEKTKEAKTLVALLINEGLRGQLVMQSYVTGQLGVHLDLFPDKPLRLVGSELGYTEIPTIGSSLSEIAKTLQNIPVAEIAEKVSKTLDGIEKLVNSPDLAETIVALHQTVNAAHALLQNLDGQVKPLSTSAGLTLGEAKKMFADAGRLARELDGRIPGIAAGLDETIKTTGATMRGASKAIDGMAGDNSPVRLEMIRTLNELASAARSLRVLADYIENHPEALLRGKGK
jgi:paraquat-inducible protein B